jgi:hypothetical protein
MSDAWEILVEHSAAGDAWERLNSITGSGTGETVVFNNTVFNELIISDVFVGAGAGAETVVFVESVSYGTFTQGGYEIFTEIDAGEL